MFELVGDKPSPGYLSSFYKVLANEERTTPAFLCVVSSHVLSTVLPIGSVLLNLHFCKCRLTHQVTQAIYSVTTLTEQVICQSYGFKIYIQGNIKKVNVITASHKFSINPTFLKFTTYSLHTLLLQNQISFLLQLVLST